jgi:hypothetical protein
VRLAGQGSPFRLLGPHATRRWGKRNELQRAHDARYERLLSRRSVREACAALGATRRSTASSPGASKSALRGPDGAARKLPRASRARPLNGPRFAEGESWLNSRERRERLSLSLSLSLSRALRFPASAFLHCWYYLPFLGVPRRAPRGRRICSQVWPLSGMTSYTLQPVESLTVGPPAEGRRRRSPPSYPKVLRARQVSALALKGRAANWLSFGLGRSSRGRLSTHPFRCRPSQPAGFRRIPWPGFLHPGSHFQTALQRRS